MKILCTESQTLSGSSTTSANANYPLDNLFNNYMQNRWYASDGYVMATLTIAISAGSNCLALFGTNATSASVTIKDSSSSTIKSQSFDLSPSNGRTYHQFWVNYPEQSGTATATIVLTATGETVYAGIVKAGICQTFNTPTYGMSESRKDHSITRELANGSLYVHKRAIVRTFNCKVLVEREDDFYYLTDIYDEYGPEPLAFLLVEDLDDLQWSVFARFDQPISGSHDYYMHSQVSFQITEVV